MLLPKTLRADHSEFTCMNIISEVKASSKTFVIFTLMLLPVTLRDLSEDIVWNIISEVKAGSKTL